MTGTEHDDIAALFLGDEADATIDEQDDATERYTLNPQQHGAYFDGTKYWFVYPIDADVQCKSGTSLGSLTDHGELIADLDWDALSYSAVFGQIAGTHYLWLFCNVAASTGITARRYELTAEGPSLDASAYASSTAGNGHMHAWPSYTSTGEIDDIYVMRQRRTGGPGDPSDMFLRVFEPDLSASTDGGTWRPSIIESPNTGIYMPLTDGYLAFVTDSGPDYAGTQEITMPTVGGAQTESAELGMDDQDYAASTLPQLHSSVVGALLRNRYYEAWMAYKNDDAEAYGIVNLWQRGPAVASSWTQLSDDLFNGDQVWHLALTQDHTGKRFYLIYAKNDTGNIRGRSIWYRTYFPDTDTLSAETKIADVRPGNKIDVIMATRSVAGGKLIVLWTEHADTINDGAYSGGHQWIFGSVVTVEQPMGSGKQRLLSSGVLA